ncbi:hypothetical protein Hden_2060 [Hyphomicrobium denitrificans ATCC 51888]|uniref:Uncharacterized protein n=1 Tax=Hyphomicrobium denitrificans (strain ATCC 51888 / DSM 1869 / NCIMB 11706 / TK 0415) TaxID=582899 RepID=D8JPX7_HYPDA|nr:hypothetical protein Hden_2060 [Hyphomicrobium denitrificans ATCC 51888]
MAITATCDLWDPRPYAAIIRMENRNKTLLCQRLPNRRL